MLGQLTKYERQLALIILICLALAGTALGIAGRDDPLGGHGALIALAALAGIFAIIRIYYEPEPDQRRLDIAPMLFTTPTGWAMLAIGSVTGGLFAAFSFAISVFSIPMLLNERTDALTAMGTSTALVWNNLPVMLTWGAILLALFLFSLATGLAGLIIVFPVIGHGTWHAYRAVSAGS